MKCYFEKTLCPQIPEGTYSIDRNEDGYIHLIQKRLAERIAEVTYFNDLDITIVETPCTGFLPLGEHGEDANEELGYHSIVGRSWTEVLSRNCSHPTLDKGLILEPTNNDTFKIDV